MPFTTLPTSGFDQGQVGDWVFTNNAYGINLPASGSSIQWNVPCGAQTGGDNCYAQPEEGGACTIDFNANDNIGNNSYVRAFPMAIWGSQGGRDTSWNAAKNGCTNSISELVAAPSRCGNSALYDMRQVAAATGYPARVDQLPDTRLCIDATVKGSGLANVFVDTYLHRIDRSNLYPTGYQNAYGDVNKINENSTETWNLNFWLCLPPTANGGNTNSDGGWTGGGTPLLQGVNIDGRSWDIYVKKEGPGNCTRDTNGNITQGGDSCTNCFFYLSFVANPQQCGNKIELHYNQFIAWVQGAQFANLVQNNGQANQVWQDIGSPPLPSSGGSFVVDGFGVGAEVWHGQGQVCFDALTMTIDGVESGKNVEVDPDPTTCTQTVCIDPDDPDPTEGCNLCLVTTNTAGTETLSCAEDGKISLKADAGAIKFRNGGTSTGILDTIPAGQIAGLPATLSTGQDVDVVVPSDPDIQFEFCCD